MRLISIGRIVLALSICLSSATTALAQAGAKAASTINQRSCLDAARAALGPGAVVLRCGDLNSSGTPEAVAALVLKPNRKRCTPASRVLILRFERAGWRKVFDAGEHFEIRNTEGYVGIDYIDDANVYRGYCVEISDRSGSELFSVGLAFIGSDDRVDEEGLPINVAWNSKVGRYQEIVSNDAPPKFAPELKNPPHINTRKPCRGTQPTSPVKKR
jgi:hypothetical protein